MNKSSHANPTSRLATGHSNKPRRRIAKLIPNRLIRTRLSSIIGQLSSQPSTLEPTSSVTTQQLSISSFISPSFYSEPSFHDLTSSKTNKTNKLTKHQTKQPTQSTKRFNSTVTGQDADDKRFHTPKRSMSDQENQLITPKLIHHDDPELAHRRELKAQFWKREFMASPVDQLIDSQTGLPKNPYLDSKSDFFDPGPKVDDDANPYAISTRLDNEEYVRQMTILNTFQEKLGDLNGFVDPFLNKNLPKAHIPSTRGEMNAMLQHCVLKDQDYELAWQRYTQMINAIPDTMKGWIEQSLFDQFNTPIVFKRDSDVMANDPKVLFGPDQRTYQLMTVACLQAFEHIKTKYEPELVETCVHIVRAASFTNSINDDECDSQATLMFRQLSDIHREMKRRKELPEEEQVRLLNLENGGLGILGHLSEIDTQENSTSINQNNSLQNVGLQRAMKSLKSTDLESTNKLEYHSSGIPLHHHDTQIREKLLATGQSIVEIVDDPTQAGDKSIKYRANRKIAADDSDTDGEFNVPNFLSPKDTTKDTKELSSANSKTHFGQPILSCRITNTGKRKYRISLPQLPFSIEEGDELEMWLHHLEQQASISLNVSQELNEIRQQVLSDPFSEEYHCYQQVVTWNSRLNFLLREILAHYYGVMHEKNPRLYKLICSNDIQPNANYSGLNPVNSSIGNSTEILDTVISAAYDQGLPHLWLEASTVKAKLSPAPIHVHTVSERKVMKKENFLKTMIFEQILHHTPTANDSSDLTALEGEDAEKLKQEIIPNLTPQQFFRCLALFTDYGRHITSYIKSIKAYDANFLTSYDIERKRLEFITSHPRKLQLDELKDTAGRLTPEKLQQKHEIIDELERQDYEDWISKEKGKIHKQIQDAQGGFLDFETKYDKNVFHQTNFDELNEEQLKDYRSKRPQPLREMIMMGQLVAETIRRYPLLASLAPPESKNYIKFDEIVTKRYGGKDKLPFMLRFFSDFPLSPTPIDITKFSFDSLEKVNNYPYPASFVEELNKMDVSMVKVPIFNLILQAPSDIQVNNDRANYKHLMLSPGASLLTLKDAIQFVNRFTHMGRVVQKQGVEMGEVEQVEEYTYQLDYQAFLQSRYQQPVKLSSILDNSLNIRNMARLGMYYIDTMLISWAQQSELKLPSQYCELVTNSYKLLTNDVFSADINAEILEASTLEGEKGSKVSKKNTTESPSLAHDLALTNPPRSRIELWKQRTINDQLTNPSKFFSLTIDQRVELIDQSNEQDKKQNTFAQFFAPDPTLEHEDVLNKYHLLRSYIRFSMRAGDEASLRKALYLYRQSTRLLEYVQRRTNEDVYAAHDKALDQVQNAEDFERVSHEIEQERVKKNEMEDNIPGSIRSDVTQDDIRKSTTKLGDKTKQLWDSWYSTDSTLKPPTDIHDSIAQDQRTHTSYGNEQEHGTQRETDDLVKHSGLLDDYASRIDALLSGKNSKSAQKSKSTDHQDDSNEYHNQSDRDEKEIELYKDLVNKQKKTNKLGSLYIPGYDQSDPEENDDSADQQIVKEHFGEDIKLKSTDGAGATDAPKRDFSSSKVGAAGAFGRGKGTSIDVDNSDNEDENTDGKHAPHTRLAKLATASHVKHDYMLTQMVINFHQFLIRNQSPLIRVGLPGDVSVKRFSDEVSSHWALARRNLYDQRIALIHSFDEKIDPVTGDAYTPSQLRDRQRDKAKSAVAMLKKNRLESSLHSFERDAGQIAIMTLDTLILEGYIPVAKIVAKQAYDDGLLSKEFIETCFDQHGPDLDADEATIMSKELGFDKLMTNN